MINFDDENFISYRKQLKNNFMFFRMLLSDEVDAIITYFISTGKVSHVELARIYEGLYSAFLKLVDTYPNKTAKSLECTLKLSKSKDITVCDTFNHHVVFRLSQILLYLLAETAHILSEIDPNVN